VTFKLHDSFHNPNQHIEKTPFEINETGWGEFEVQVKIHFTPMVLEKPVILYHMIRLHPLQDTKNVWKVGDMVYSVRYDEFVA
jgi:YEATS domain-containing protein 4